MDDDEYRRREKRSSYPRPLYVPEGSRGLKSNASTRLITLIGIILLTGFQSVKCRLSDTGMNTMQVGDRRACRMVQMLASAFGEQERMQRNHFMRLFVQKCKRYKFQTQCFELLLITNFDTVHGVCMSPSQTERRCCVLRLVLQ